MSALVRNAGLGGEIEVDSAGTGRWHVGESADRRARAVARSRGYDLTSRARQFSRGDFARFDFVLAMDRDNRRELLRLARSDAERGKIALFRDFDPDAGSGDLDVPDPYYGGPSGFDDVFDLCERTCQNLLEHICRERGLDAGGGS